jgi:hypothetical protein
MGVPISTAAAAPAFALTREQWTFGALWDHSLASFQREWVGLSAAALVMMLALNGISVAGAIVVALFDALTGAGEDLTLGSAVVSGLLMVVQFLAQCALSLGLMRIALDVLHGEKADVARLFSQLRKGPAYLGAMLATMVLMLLPYGLLGAAGYALHTQGLLSETQLIGAGIVAFLLLMVPFTYVFLPTYFLPVELALEDRPQLLQAVRTCYRVAQGNRLSMLGVSLLAGVLLMVGFIMCLVGVFPALGFMNLLLGGLYLALRRT